MLTGFLEALYSQWLTYVLTLVVVACGGFFVGRAGAKPSPSRRSDDAENPQKTTTNAPDMSPSKDAASAGGDGGLSPYAGPVCARFSMPDDSRPDNTVTSDRLQPEILSLAPDDENGNGGKTQRKRVIIIAYRLPVHIARGQDAQGRPQWRVTGWDDVRSFLANFRTLQQPYRATGVAVEPMDVQWVGYPGVDVPRSEQHMVDDLLDSHNCRAVYLPAQLHKRFYLGFCKRTLWPLLHYVSPHFNTAFGIQWESLWQAYTAVNMLYSKRAAVLVQSDADYLWVHNYHLLVLPSFLRKKYPRAKIGFFMHTPFPTSDVFRTIPSRESILRGVLNADLIGFHTFDYGRHFLSSVKRVLDLDYEVERGGLGIRYSGRSVLMRISHVGILPRALVEVTESPSVQQRVDLLRARYKGRQVILGIDDFDLVKGSLLKIQAFSMFLDSDPSYVNKCVLVELVMPSRNAQTERDAVRKSIMEQVRRISEKHGSQVVEVLEYAEEPSLEELVAYYVVSDAAVVSTFWDGLNTIPYEYTAVQDAKHPGSLVVSEFMGCSSSLSGVVRVNPWSVTECAEAFRSVVFMSPEERQRNHARRFQYVMNNSLQRWSIGFLKDLDRASGLTDNLEFVQVGWGSNVQLVCLRSDFTHLDISMVMPAYLRSSHRVLVFDYDGTLTSSGSDPQLSSPSSQVLACLQILASDPHNTVFILSGRQRTKLWSWFGSIKNLGLAAEKGAFIRWPEQQAAPEQKQPAEWQHMCPMHDFEWKKLALKIMKEYLERTDGAYIEDKEASLVFHYEHTDLVYGRMQASELAKYIDKVKERADVEVVRYDYNRIVEVKPKGVSKGRTLNLIIERSLARAKQQQQQQQHHQQQHQHQQIGGVSPVLDAMSPDLIGGISPLQQPQAGQFNGSQFWLDGSDEAPTALHTSTTPFVLCIGDDRSDEEMFASLQNSIYSDGQSDDVRTAHTSVSSTEAAKHLERRPENAVVPSAARKVAKTMHGYDFGAKGRKRSKRSVAANGDGFSPETMAVDDNKGSARLGVVANNRRRSGGSRSSFTVCVGLKPSKAHYYLHDVDEVIELLSALASCTRPTGAVPAVAAGAKVGGKQRKLALARKHLSALAPVGNAAQSLRQRPSSMRRNPRQALAGNGSRGHSGVLADAGQLPLLSAARGKLYGPNRGAIGRRGKRRAARRPIQQL